MKSFEIPAFISSSSLNCLWVVPAGYVIIERTSPKLVAWISNLSDSINFTPSPFKPNAIKDEAPFLRYF